MAPNWRQEFFRSSNAAIEAFNKQDNRPISDHYCNFSKGFAGEDGEIYFLRLPSSVLELSEIECLDRIRATLFYTSQLEMNLPADTDEHESQ